MCVGVVECVGEGSQSDRCVDTVLGHLLDMLCLDVAL